jgi:prepilin-type N-terminal cleavage/methylation domain-containing protein
MTYLNTDTKSGEKGFTLVELAIVMIIIGLLIGGILKGQELITNARVAATATQMKGYDAAVNTFRDSYSAFPGDMRDANTRLPQCTGSCGANPTAAGTGNGRIEQNNFPAVVAGNEAHKFWLHMNAANVLSGVENVDNLTFGDALPAANIGGGYQVSFSSDGQLLGMSLGGTATRPGHYIALSNQPGVIDANNGVTASDLVRRIDEKVDDGQPNSGSLLAIGQSGPTFCAEAAGTTAAANVYPVNGQTCGAYFRIQQ